MTAWHDVTMEIEITGPIFKMNDLPGMGHHQHAALTKRWRTDTEAMFGLRSMRWRAPSPVGIEVHTRCRVKADRSAYVPAAKAMIDGLTDSFATAYGRKVRVHEGWWPNDSPDWVTWERHWPPVVDRSLPVGHIAVRLEIVVL